MTCEEVTRSIMLSKFMRYASNACRKPMYEDQWKFHGITKEAKVCSAEFYQRWVELALSWISAELNQRWIESALSWIRAELTGRWVEQIGTSQKKSRCIECALGWRRRRVDVALRWAALSWATLCWAALTCLVTLFSPLIKQCALGCIVPPCFSEGRFWSLENEPQKMLSI